MSRSVAVVLVALGLAGVGVALGLIYIDFREREGRWLELTTRAKAHGDDPSQQDLAPWFDHTHAYAALGAGTAGVACLGAGFMMALFQLRVFRAATDAEKF